MGKLHFLGEKSSFLRHSLCRVTLNFAAGNCLPGTRHVNLLCCPYLQVGQVHLAQHQTTPPCWEGDADLRGKAESWMLWRADNLSLLIHLLSSRSIQFHQFCLIWGLWGVKKAKKNKKSKIKHVISLISGVSSAKIIRECSCKS